MKSKPKLGWATIIMLSFLKMFKGQFRGIAKWLLPRALDCSKLSARSAVIYSHEIHFQNGSLAGSGGTGQKDLLKNGSLTWFGQKVGVSLHRVLSIIMS